MIYVCFHTIECISTNLGYIACCSVGFIPLDCSGLLFHNAFAGFVLASNFSLQTAYLELLNSLQPPSYCSTCTVTTHFHIMQWITILQSFKHLRASISINNARINLFLKLFVMVMIVIMWVGCTMIIFKLIHSWNVIHLIVINNTYPSFRTFKVYILKISSNFKMLTSLTMHYNEYIQRIFNVSHH